MTATYLACLTPPGTAALATLALYGPQAWILIRELFQPAGSTPLPVHPERYKFWFGQLGNSSGKDEVVLAVKQEAPVPLLEIHCHGGLQVLALFQEIFTSRGVQLCSWQELYRQGDFPRWRIAAEEVLTQALTVRTAAILLDQFHGAFHLALTEIVAHLQAFQVAHAQRLLAPLLARIPLGLHLVKPWQVVLAGPPNVGKSSLANALAGFTRSVVSHEPGTTRDVVTIRLALDGWPVELADTAGWRTAHEPLEQAGINRARSSFAQADLVLWLLDASAPPTFPDMPLPNVLFVINKIDLPPTWNLSQVPGAVPISAKTGTGVTDLCQQIACRLVPVSPAAGEPVPYSAQLCLELEKVHLLLEEGKNSEPSQLVQKNDFLRRCLAYQKQVRRTFLSVCPSGRTGMSVLQAPNFVFVKLKQWRDDLPHAERQRPV